MILVDTSVWIEHLRRADARLQAMLEEGKVLSHPFVVGELACGNLGRRSEILELLSRLPMAPVASEGEVLGFIERRKLVGRRIGYLDAHLLASASLAAPARLWTRDHRLHRIAASLSLAVKE